MVRAFTINRPGEIGAEDKCCGTAEEETELSGNCIEVEAETPVEAVEGAQQVDGRCGEGRPGGGLTTGEQRASWVQVAWGRTTESL